MKIEKLTDNKIRIIMNIDDLAKKNIDIHYIYMVFTTKDQPSILKNTHLLSLVLFIFSHLVATAQEHTSSDKAYETYHRKSQTLQVPQMRRQSSPYRIWDARPRTV